MDYAAKSYQGVVSLLSASAWTGPSAALMTDAANG